MGLHQTGQDDPAAPVDRGDVVVPREVRPDRGDDEVAALRDLDERLRGVPKPDGTRIEELRARLRLAYVDGAEEWSREHESRSLTHDEMLRVLTRYAGR